MAKRYDKLVLNYYDPSKSDEKNIQNEEKCFKEYFDRIYGETLVRMVLILNNP